MTRSPRIRFACSVCLLLALAACTDGDSTTTPPTTARDANSESPTEPDEAPDQAVPDGVAESEQPGAQPGLGGLPGAIVVRDDLGQIVVVEPTGADAVTLSNEDGSDHTQPTWSSTGERVAWSSFGGDGARLSIADRDGANAASLDVASPAFYLSWSGNDAWIGGLRPTPNGMEMFVADGGATMDQFVSDSQPCLLYTSPSPRDQRGSRMPSSA